MMMHDACHAYIDGHRTRSVGIALGVPLPDPAYRMCFSMVTGGRARVVVVVVIKRKSTIIKRKELIELVRLGGAGAIKAWWCQPDYYYLFTRLRWNAKAKGRPGKRAGGGGLEDGKV